MIMCRQVAKALAHERYYELSWHRKIAMFIHIRLCIMCGKYHQQVVDFQKGVHEYLKHEDDGSLEMHLHLSDEAKKRIETAINTSET